jgi:hypothetical protein
MNSGEALIPGEDFFLNPNEMELWTSNNVKLKSNDTRAKS